MASDTKNSTIDPDAQMRNARMAKPIEGDAYMELGQADREAP